jgi:hypothetical protein
VRDERAARVSALGERIGIDEPRLVVGGLFANLREEHRQLARLRRRRAFRELGGGGLLRGGLLRGGLLRGGLLRGGLVRACHRTSISVLWFERTGLRSR